MLTSDRWAVKSNTMQLSIRTNIIFTIGLMGLLGFIFALVTGEIFRHLAIENQRSALGTLTQHEVNVKLDHLTDLGREFLNALLKEEKFQSAQRASDPIKIAAALDDQFFQYYITARVISVARLYYLDNELNLVTASNQGRTELGGPESTCPRLIARAKLRNGAARIKSMYEFCVSEGEGFFAMLLPLGLMAKSYLFILIEPATTLAKAENALGMPMMIFHPSGSVASQSPNWPANVERADLLLADADFKTSDNEIAMRAIVASDISSLNAALQRARLAILFGVLFFSAGAVAFSLWILNRSMLNPLTALARHLGKIRSNSAQLGDQLPLNGNPEVRALTEDFNQLTKKLQSSYQKLETMAFTDSLTSLPNRSLLQEALVFHTNTAQKKGVPFAFFMMDMDRFKAINDTLGHQAGDILLQQVGRRLEKALRKTDTVARIGNLDIKRLDQETVARLGGDEFAAVLPGVGTREEASIVAKKILREVSEVIEIDGVSVSANISIGIAICPENGMDANAIMRCADIAMYQAKKSQLGFDYYDATQDTNSVNFLKLERDLIYAIEKDDQLVPYVQPIVDLNSNRVCCVETLLYWQHPEQGLIPPQTFIPIAEETGLIVSLTTWVLHSAARLCLQMPKTKTPLEIAVNLSARSLQNDTILDQLDQILSTYSIPRGMLSLELTETAVMTDLHRSLEVLSQFDRRGVGLSLDDFGAGYTSLQYLKALPLDKLKIDRSFISDMLTDRNDEVIVHSIIELAHNMGMQVVAEGVQDEATMDKLKALKCDFAQGYYIAKPMPFDDFLRWLENTQFFSPSNKRISR